MRRRPSLRVIAALGFVLALLFPPSAPFAALCLPAIVGEGLARRWPRAGVAFGALLVWGLVVAIALLGRLCGLGETGSSHACDHTIALTWWFGGAAVALTGLACVWPRRRAPRYALWSTPAVMLVSLIVLAF